MLFWLFLAFGAKAQEIIELQSSVRAMGMGNAYTAIVADGDALWYNPANLCRVDGYNWTILDLRAAANGLQASQQVASVSGASSASDYSGLFGTDVTFDAGTKTAIFIPCIGVTGYGNAYAGFKMKNPVYPELQLRYQADYGVKVGFASTLAPGVYLGAAVSRLVRQGGEVPFGPGFITSPNSTSAQQQFENMGAGYGLDIGFTWALPTGIAPIFSLVWKNAGQTGFTKIGGGQSPDTQKDEIAFGMAFDLDTTFVRIVPSIDIKHINRNDIEFGKKVHAGMEIDLPLVAVRGGFHQGYWTLGAGLDLFFLRFDVASWGVEKGVYPGQDEDRRYAAMLTLEIGFDTDFNFSGFNTNSTNRRLKQRR